MLRVVCPEAREDGCVQLVTRARVSSAGKFCRHGGRVPSQCQIPQAGRQMGTRCEWWRYRERSGISRWKKMAQSPKSMVTRTCLNSRNERFSKVAIRIPLIFSWGGRRTLLQAFQNISTNRKKKKDWKTDFLQCRFQTANFTMSPKKHFALVES